jgi:hypothetical protein
MTMAKKPSQAEIQATRDVKARCARLVTALDAIATNPDAAFADPRSVFIDLILAGHEIDAAIFVLRRCWWP